MLPPGEIIGTPEYRYGGVVQFAGRAAVGVEELEEHVHLSLFDAGTDEIEA